MIGETFTALTLPYGAEHTKTVRVYVPAHEEGETLPVIYMTDGQNLFGDIPVKYGCWYVGETVREHQQATGHAAVIVGIYNDGEAMERAGELTPKALGAFFYPPEMPPEARPQLIPTGEVFDDFVVNTVMPAVEAQFPVKKGRAYTAFCGSSCGGVQTFYTVLSHPEKFSCGGVFSPAFPVYVPQDLEQWIRSHVPTELPFLYCYGGGCDPLEHQISLSLESVFAVLQDCCPADKLHKVIAPDQPHHESAWQMVFKEFLTRFLEG